MWNQTSSKLTEIRNHLHDLLTHMDRFWPEHIFGVNRKHGNDPGSVDLQNIRKFARLVMEDIENELRTRHSNNTVNPVFKSGSTSSPDQV